MNTHYLQMLGITDWQLRAALSSNTQSKFMLISDASQTLNHQKNEAAWRLLNAMLKAINVEVTDIHLTELMSCSANHAATETTFCEACLQQEIAEHQPSLLIAVGETAAQGLLNNTSSLESLRKQVFHYGETKLPLIVTYHPEHLLSQPLDKKNALADLHLIQKQIS